MNELNVQELRPGILVTEFVSLKGGIHYDREDEESYFDDKTHVREWRTVSRIDDPVERAIALRLRSKMYSLVRKQCVRTPVGLICDEANKPKLLKALQQVKKERDEFNDRAKTCRLVTSYAYFDVKADNHQTIAAIMEQIAGVAEEVNKAITQDDEKTLKQSSRKWLKGMKPDAILLLPQDERDALVARVRAELIRKAIRDIKGVERLLPDDAVAKTETLVKQSRVIARTLCNKVEKHNQALDNVLNEVDTTGIRKNRAAFIMAAARAEKRSLTEDEKLPLVDSRKIVKNITV